MVVVDYEIVVDTDEVDRRLELLHSPREPSCLADRLAASRDPRGQ
jgi:hypothetical protein